MRDTGHHDDTLLQDHGGDEHAQDHGGEHDAAPPEPPVLLDAAAQPRFVTTLPRPAVIDATAGGQFVIEMREVEHRTGLVGPDGAPLVTTVWGYGLEGEAATWPGPTILARSGVPVEITWRNALPVGSDLIPVDHSIAHHGAAGDALMAGLMPTVVHLHGGHTPSRYDGLPGAWFTQEPGLHGPDWPGPVTPYENDQRAAPLWYHDHAMGLTRTSTYAGLAGFWQIGDALTDSLVARNILPGPAATVPLAIQDRAFTADGALYYTAHPDDPLPGTGETVADTLPEGYDGPLPTVVPEFFGDVITVNGAAWPTLEVEGHARLQILNGSDSRFYLLELDNPHARLTLVGSDGGLLPRAITVMDGDGVQDAGEFLVLGPSDRVEVVLDLTDPQVTGPVTLLNRGPAYEPFKGLTRDGALAGPEEAPVTAAAPGDPVGAVMQFLPVAGAQPAPLALHHGTLLDPGFERLTRAEADGVRELGLFEVEDAYGRVTPQLGVASRRAQDSEGNPVPFGPLPFEAPATEVIRQGDTEVWRINNFSEDAHPIHLHGLHFQVLGRREIMAFDRIDNASGERGEDGMPDAVRQGATIPLRPEDLGWQDTTWVGPGESVSIIARFDEPGTFVWHCHILSHEDHDMMRPFVVLPQDAVL